jgi:Holliday junction resolvasome RuvABC ATP-dependent DNA helicase subunit
MELSVPNWDKELNRLVGQEEIKAQMLSKIAFSKANSYPLPHLLFCGLPKCGKNRLANLLAICLDVPLQIACGKDLKRPKDLLPFLTSAQEFSIVAIDEIELLGGNDVIEFLLPVLTEGKVDLVLGEGLNARTISMQLKRLTLIGTTTKPSRVDKRLVHWLAAYDFRPYTFAEFQRIVWIMLIQQNFECSADVLELVSSCCDQSLERASVIVRKMGTFVGKHEEMTLTLERTKEILDWMGYNRGITSVDIATVVRSLSGTDFEQYVASVFKNSGYSVEYTPATGDHGIDLMLRKDNENAVVQCKRWEGSVGEPVVREFLGSMIGANAEVGYIVTTGQFTTQAIEFADKHRIKLVDLDGLLILANGRIPLRS